MRIERGLGRFLAVSRGLHTASRALSLSMVLASSPAAATSLLSGFDTPLYVEDYQGEFSYPTSPELDALGIGALTPLLLGNAPLPPPATLTGTSARVDMSTSAGAEAFQGVGLTNAAPMSLGPNLDLALHIEADSFTESLVGDGQVVLGATLFSDSGVNLFASLVHLPGAGRLTLHLGEETDSLFAQKIVLLSTTATAAILSGGAFEIDLVLDRRTGSIDGAIRANAEEFVAPTLLLSQLGTQSIVQMTHTSLVYNTLGDDDGLMADFRRMQLHVRAHEPSSQCDDSLDNDGDGIVDNDDPGCATSGGETELPRNDVQIDVVPFSDQNKVLPKPNWIISVAVLASDTVDVDLVDRDSLAFGPDGAGSILEFPLDVNRDRDRDLVTMYFYKDTGLPLGQSEACLTGLVDGIPFEACDSVNVQVSCGLGVELALLLPSLMWIHARRRKVAA